MRFWIRSGVVALFAAPLLLTGCQGNPSGPASVSGTVKYNGAPVTGGTITFHRADGEAIPYPISNDGTYSVPQIQDGQMVVTVDTESINPAKQNNEFRAKGPFQKAGAKMKYAPAEPPAGTNINSPVYVKIPAKYADKATSGLTVTLKKGSQTFNVDLTD